MGNLEQVNGYFGEAIRLTATNNRDGTFRLMVTACGGHVVYDGEYDEEVEFIADLRSIRAKFTVLENYFKELEGG